LDEGPIAEGEEPVEGVAQCHEPDAEPYDEEHNPEDGEWQCVPALRPSQRRRDERPQVIEPDRCGERDPGRQGELQDDREGLAYPGHRDPVPAAEGHEVAGFRRKWPEEQREDGIVEDKGHGGADHHRRDAEEETVPNLLEMLDEGHLASWSVMGASDG